MGRTYSQLGIEDRCEIARLHAAGTSIRQIAAALDRQPSTIAREVRRNRTSSGQYVARHAQNKTWARRWSGSKLDRDEALRQQVLSLLSAGWSPEQIARRLQEEQGRQVISYETIYRFIFKQIPRRKEYAWRHLLPRAKSRRGRYRVRGGSPASFIALRCPISERPSIVAGRTTPGHWEADLMNFSTYGQAILFLHERHSRLLIAVRPRSKEADVIIQEIKHILEPLPPAWRQSVTFDNGTEFAFHYELHDIDTETYFCDVYAPWQKGGVENAIGRMRRRLPRKTDLATLSEEQFRMIVQLYNNTPRKCLDYRTPAEVFWDKLLHFKCESTFPLSRE